MSDPYAPKIIEVLEEIRDTLRVIADYLTGDGSDLESPEKPPEQVVVVMPRPERTEPPSE